MYFINKKVQISKIEQGVVFFRSTHILGFFLFITGLMVHNSETVRRLENSTLNIDHELIFEVGDIDFDFFS